MTELIVLIYKILRQTNKKIIKPWLGGSVEWASSHKLKGHQFASQSEHTPGCRPGARLGVCKRQPHIDVSPLSFYLPPPLSKNIEIKIF